MRGKWYRNARLSRSGRCTLARDLLLPSCFSAAGKELPMYRLGYQPGCWPLRLRLTPPAVYRLARLRVPVRGRPLG